MKVKDFLLSQAVDDVGSQCVKLEISLAFTGLSSLFDLGLAIIFASLSGAWFWGILISIGWIAFTVVGIVLPLQRRTKALPVFMISTVVLSILSFAFYVYELVFVARGGAKSKGAVAVFAILFVFWILRFVALGFVCYFCLQTVRAVPTNKSRASLFVSEDESKSAYTAPSKPQPSPEVEPSMTL